MQNATETKKNIDSKMKTIRTGKKVSCISFRNPTGGFRFAIYSTPTGSDSWIYRLFKNGYKTKYTK